jgi:dipeptidyl aminopeptidase/acylaminoacyl peptidase
MARRIVAAAFVALSAWAGVLATAQAAESLPVADFFRRPKFVDMVMSPNGKLIAATVAGAAGRVGLAVIDLQDLSRSKNVATFGDADILTVQWVNDDRLVFNISDRRQPYGEQKGSGLYAVDRDGNGGVRKLIQREWRQVTAATTIVDRSFPPDHALLSVLRDGSSDVLIERHVYDNQGEPQGSVLLRLDTRTGHATGLAQGAPAHVFDWTLDGAGVPRVAITNWAGKGALHWKASADKPWTLVREFKAYGDRNGPPDPLVIDADDVLYARGRVGADGDTAALLRIDMRSGTLMAHTVLALEGYDFSGSLVRDARGKVLGVRYLTEARETHWFDPGMATVQKQVDALLPGTNNRVSCGDCEKSAQMLVRSSSDRQPPVFRLFDTKAGTVSQLAASRPWVNPAAMATRDMVRITTRDGLSIPVHVTLPKGTGPAPMVVLVHGGPYVRGGEWRWDEDSQFLASRGYVVVEPEFRGSTGFGDKLYRAGFKQWGLAMQDDIADATMWAIKQGHADAGRVCIAGASYGGYAALMGLIRYPEMYRCGFEWVGVTDIELMYSNTWSDSTDMWKDHGMPVMVGDRVKDAEQLAATSPLKLAAKLKQPLLMAYGGEDRRVPIEHGLKMRDALRAHNPNVEWVSYPSEGHGWMLEANDIDFWTRVEKFLDRHLKNPP